MTTDPSTRLDPNGDLSEDPSGDSALTGYVDLWWQAVNDFTTLLEKVPAEQWSTPTDLPGWDVHAVAAHTAHLEALLAGGPEETVEIGEPPHARGMMGRFTEQGVVARRDATPDDAHQRDPRVAPPPATRRCWPTRRPTRDAPPPRPLRRASAGPPDAAAQPAAGRVDARAGRTPRGRPARRPRRRRGRGTPPTTCREPGLRLAKRVGADPGTTVVLEVEGHRPVGARPSPRRPGPAARRGPHRPDGRAAHRPRVLHPAGRRPPRAGAGRASRSSATPSSRAGSWPGWPSPREQWPARLVARRHPRPDRPHRAGHRHDAGGLGHHTALELARAGARVVLAGRGADRLTATDEAIRLEVPGARLDRLVVDLADLGSVRRAGEEATRSARSTCSSTTPGSWPSRSAGPPTGSSRRWRPTTSARSC